MISASDISNGVNLKIDNQIYTVIWFQHHKPGKGGAMIRLKLKDLRSGAIIERTVRTAEKFEEVILDRRKMQYLYKDGENYIFMDNNTYEQFNINADHLGENTKFLKDNTEVEVVFYEQEILGIQLPTAVSLKVTYTEKGLKGDTVSSTMKPATLETGAEVMVPLFVEIGDVIKIDTRTGEYIQRE